MSFLIDLEQQYAHEGYWIVVTKGKHKDRIGKVYRQISFLGLFREYLIDFGLEQTSHWILVKRTKRLYTKNQYKAFKTMEEFK